MAVAPTSFASPLIAALRGGISDTGSASTVSLLPNMAPNYAAAAPFKSSARTGNINVVQPFAPPSTIDTDQSFDDVQSPDGLFNESMPYRFDMPISIPDWTYQEPINVPEPEPDYPVEDIVIPDWDVLPEPIDEPIPVPDYTEDLWPPVEQEPAPEPLPIPDYTEDLWPPVEPESVQEPIPIPDYTQDLWPSIEEAEPLPIPDYTEDLWPSQEDVLAEQITISDYTNDMWPSIEDTFVESPTNIGGSGLTPDEYAFLEMLYGNQFIA